LRKSSSRFFSTTFSGTVHPGVSAFVLSKKTVWIFLLPIKASSSGLWAFPAHRHLL
jgi:hypothetical protein